MLHTPQYTTYIKGSKRGRSAWLRPAVLADTRRQINDRRTSISQHLLSSAIVGPAVLRELLGCRDDDPGVRIEKRPKGRKGRTLFVYGRLCALLESKDFWVRTFGCEQSPESRASDTTPAYSTRNQRTVLDWGPRCKTLQRV